jgi:NAD(P)-dependent dehydrogenase (short-subunit alcohol dehydrogenase family)
MSNIFDLTGKTAIITGAGGLLGPKHAEAILEFGGNVLLTDWHIDRLEKKSNYLSEKFGKNRVFSKFMNVCDKDSIENCINEFENEGHKIDILINNAAKDPKVKNDEETLKNDSRFENMTQEFWIEGIDAAINGTFLVSQSVINRMLKNNTKGVILNISSDLGVIAPDQRIYRKDDLDEGSQPVKPITYSAAKWAIVGMTKYLAVYFAQRGIRVNCLSPTGVYNNHPVDFVKRLSNIIPMGRMADIDEYKGAIVFLCSDASSYMTGENMIIDGGKTVW